MATTEAIPFTITPSKTTTTYTTYAIFGIIAVL